MSSRSLGVVSLERLLAVERYRESHHPASTAAVAAPAPGRADAGRRRPRADGTSAKAR
jgi:hypothetical protein